MIQNAMILLVCDDPVNCSAWLACLETLPAQLAQAQVAVEALRTLAEVIPDLVLVDQADAAGDGLEVCARLRELAIIPILHLIPAYDESLILSSYQTGVDEVVVKPFSPAVLRAKVSAWLRRAQSVPVSELSAIERSGLRLDPNGQQVMLDGGQRVRLSNLEFRLLLLLMSQPGRIFDPADLIQRVWGYATGRDTVVLKNVVYRLRRKIEPDPEQPRLLLTHGSQGYSFRG